MDEKATDSNPEKKEQISLTSKCLEVHLRMISEVMSSWENLVPYLGLDESHRTSIMKDHIGYDEQKYQVLLKWKQVNGDDATLKNLLTCISHSGDQYLRSRISKMISTKFISKSSSRDYEDLYSALPDGKCSKLHLQMICSELREWEPLIPYLQLNEADKKNLIHCYPTDYARQKYEMFIKWQDRYQEKANYQKLMDCLIDSSNRDIADTLKMICTSQNIPYSQYFTTSFNKYREFLQWRYNNLEISASSDECLDYTSSEYIDLTLVELDRNDDGLVGSIEEIITNHKIVSLAGLLQFPKDKERICLIEGGAGMGKSTLSIQLCKLWSKGHFFKQYSAFILLTLRDPGLQEAKSAKDFLLTLNDELRDEVFREITRDNGENVCFIFEGFDELPPRLRKHRLFSKLTEDLPKCTLMYTSRPESCFNIKRKASQRLQILGFKLEQAFHYIHNVLEAKKHLRMKIPDLIKTIESNFIIQTLLSIPINVAIIIYLYITDGSLPNTITKLYNLLCLQLMLRHVNQRTANENETTSLTSLNHLPVEVEVPFKEICCIAYKTLVKDELVFTADMLHTKGIVGIGLLVMSTMHSSYGHSKVYSFLHLTLHEFCAAWYISKLPTSEQSKCLKETYHLSRFYVVWQFYAGMTQLQNQDIFQMMLEKCSTFVKSWHGKSNIACMILGLYEANNSMLLHKFGDHLNGSINFSYYSLDQRCCTALGYFLQHYGNKLCLLNLFSSNTGDNGMETVLNGLIKCKSFDENLNFTLDIARNNLTISSAQVVSTVIAAVSSLQMLILDHNHKLSTGVCEIITKAVKSVCLKRLSLYFTSSDAFKVLLLPNTLSSIEISRNEFTLIEFSENHSLTEQNHSLTELKLNQCIISRDPDMSNGIKKLCTLFKSYSCLQLIELQNNALGDADISELSSFLVSTENIISSIDLSENNITCKGIEHLHYVIYFKSHDITAINLSNNPLKDEGVKLIINTIFKTNCLHDINISKTKTSVEINSFISRVFHNKTSLRSLAFTPVGSCHEINSNDTFGYLEEVSLEDGSSDGIENTISTLTKYEVIKMITIMKGTLTTKIILNLQHLLKMRILACLKLLNISMLPTDSLAIGQALQYNRSLKILNIWPASEHERLNKQNMKEFVEYLQNNYSLLDLTLWVTTEARADELLIQELEEKVQVINLQRNSIGCSIGGNLNLHLRPF